MCSMERFIAILIYNARFKSPNTKRMAYYLNKLNFPNEEDEEFACSLYKKKATHDKDNSPYLAEELDYSNDKHLFASTKERFYHILDTECIKWYFSGNDDRTLFSVINNGRGNQSCAEQTELKKKIDSYMALLFTKRFGEVTHSMMKILRILYLDGVSAKSSTILNELVNTKECDQQVSNELIFQYLFDNGFKYPMNILFDIYKAGSSIETDRVVECMLNEDMITRDTALYYYKYLNKLSNGIDVFIKSKDVIAMFNNKTKGEHTI